MLASIQKIVSVEKHPNADALSLCGVLGYICITKLDQYKVGDLICFVEPDTILPEKPWSVFYRSKSSRVKSIRLRNFWSQGVIETLENVGYTGPIEEGLDISEQIGVTKYEPPTPQDLNAKGLLPFGIPKTDENRLESMRDIPWGATVDVLLKIDGQSASYFWHLDDDGVVHEGVLGRTMEYKTDCINNYTQNLANLDILNKLSTFCRAKGLRGICVRGESHGKGIQKFANNPHAKLNLGWAMFSVWLTHEKRYARKGDPFYFLNIAEELRLPTVPVIERDVPLTRELAQRYTQDLEALNGQPFEGVVLQGDFGSCKCINKKYDSLK